ncbi:MAG: sigma-54-dependent Fis family transcriptional regulator [Rhodocyclaceae bacterium]|jgi:two-component system nitrogen regulation response regulator NtrX|nr:sigma-54-dependent Fis family transcriptional regulator [Rhodocyclaceae bacterium]MCE2722503.1 sigma-54 dependent transcriptional regulator [Betaproteobacteria bacterium]MCA3018122.1 sigma-54-dependent Fis family transcriptional regulator [Rhodocyclaceae bacterium]MCA3023084.1 sigma-54-dependent Fis family transcriptional regulator [Rhodocyclaceae bacterium]MCA3026441.1 sigma-54-dependent Fis family transcriptional regulator [Rhodocyclaceae bacterium]
MPANNILVVDDEIGIRELLSEILKDEGYSVRVAENAATARVARREARPDLVLLDIWMPDMDGISLLKEWAQSGQLTMPVVMMSGHGTIESAIEATRIGAFDFLEKPISLPKLVATVGKALAGGRVLAKPGLSFAHLGRAKVIAELRQRLDQVSRLRMPLLLTGESGCGFELIARMVHLRNTPWFAPSEHAWLAQNPFAPLAEARDGVLFVENIERLTRNEQRGLSQLITKLEKFNVRLVAATSHHLIPMIEAGEFDSNLHAQLSGISLRIPSLREHAEDIPDLANTMLLQMVESNESPMRSFSVGALNALRNLEWPGNLPVLQNAVKTLALTSLATEITTDDVARVAAELGLNVAVGDLPMGGIPFDLPLREARERFEFQYFLHHIRHEEGNMSRVADKVGLERTHLYRKLKQLGIRPSGKTE